MWRNLLFLILMASPAVAAEAVDLELVLAVDASGSVDDGEYHLQMDGIAAGLRDPDVQKAISSGPHGKIAISLLVWADHLKAKDKSGWFRLTSPGDAEAFARLVENFPRRQNGGTGLGAGVAEAISEIVGNGYDGTQQTVDVSGDGGESAPHDFAVLMPQAREMAVFHGITINGLAVFHDEPQVISYYQHEVRTGPGSFVMAASNFDHFAEAMRLKLLREIGWKLRVSAR